MAEKVRRTIWFEPEVWSQLEEAIETSGKTMTGIVNEAVRQYLQSSQDAEAWNRAIEERLSIIEAHLGITRE